MQNYVDMANNLAAEIEVKEKHLERLRVALNGLKPLLYPESSDDQPRALPFSARQGAVIDVHDVSEKAPKSVTGKTSSKVNATKPATGKAAPAKKTPGVKASRDSRLAPAAGTTKSSKEKAPVASKNSALAKPANRTSRPATPPVAQAETTSAPAATPKTTPVAAKKPSRAKAKVKGTSTGATGITPTLTPAPGKAAAPAKSAQAPELAVKAAPEASAVPLSPEPAAPAKAPSAPAAKKASPLKAARKQAGAVAAQAAGNGPRAKGNKAAPPTMPPTGSEFWKTLMGPDSFTTADLVSLALKTHSLPESARPVLANRLGAWVQRNKGAAVIEAGQREGVNRYRLA